MTAATPKDAKESLRRVVDFGGYDGHGYDDWKLRIAQCIEDLEVALASQIEITNIERAARYQAERLLVAAQSASAAIHGDEEIAALFRKRNMLENPLSADEVDEQIDALLRKQFAARWPR